ncbi:MAG: hypothetical protein GY898_22275 [Proteobacteria bacterium]|nr:hypothetical protein [Pseudomonadota bacterium]
MAKDIPLQGVEAAQIVRRNLWELFEQTYLNRQLACMPCHNSEWAITDDEDPEFDRSWPMEGHHEEALFGDHTGRDPEELYTLFRKHEVLGGYNVFEQQYDIRPTGCAGNGDPGCDGCACEEYVCDIRPQCCSNSWDPECVSLCNEADAGCTPRLPDDFDGCTALYGYEGCGGCGCEAAVCAQLPQCCEGSWTEFCAERCRLWLPENCEYPGGYYDYWDFGPDAIAPWGMHEKCGKFNPPGFNGPDPLNQDSFFIEPYGPEVTIWDVERPLHEGVDQLRDGLDLDGNKPTGPEAFAFLMSARVAEVAWKEIYGSSLTVPNHFPRNAAQRDTLQEFTRAFYTNDYSMVELIVRAALHPDFNAVAPADLTDEEASPYAMERGHNPWSPTTRSSNTGATTPATCSTDGTPACSSTARPRRWAGPIGPTSPPSPTPAPRGGCRSTSASSSRTRSRASGATTSRASPRGSSPSERATGSPRGTTAAAHAPGPAATAVPASTPSASPSPTAATCAGTSAAPGSATCAGTSAAPGSAATPRRAARRTWTRPSPTRSGWTC